MSLRYFCHCVKGHFCDREPGRKSLAGFTLIELIIVVVIIATLVALGTVQYKNIISKTKAAKAKHAITLIAQAEKIYQTDNGVYLDTSTGSIDNDIGTSVTGINLASVDNDNDFSYLVTAATSLITAKNLNKIGSCPKDSSINFTLSDGSWTVPQCYK